MDNMHGSRNFFLGWGGGGGGGGGGVQARRPENSLGNVVLFFCLLALNLFYSLQRGFNGLITEKTISLQGSRGGPTFSRGVQLFPGEGSKC